MRPIFSTIAPALVALIATGAGLAFLYQRQPGTGQVDGVVRLEKTGAPLADSTVYLIPTFEYESGEETGAARRLRARTDENGHFSLRGIPVGTYKIDTSAKNHSVEDRSETVIEGQTTRIDLTLARTESDVNVNGSRQKVWTRDETPTIPVTGYVGAGGSRPIVVSLRRARLSDALRDPKSSEALRRIDTTYEGPTETLPESLKKIAGPEIARVEIPVNDADREGFFSQKLKLPRIQAKPGLYFATIENAGKTACSWVVCTDTALIVKNGDPKRAALAYAVDMTRGTPIAANVPVLRIRNGREVSRALTDSRGIATIPPAGPADSEASDSRDTFVALNGADEAAVSDQIQRGATDSHVVHAYTDRTLYRPGHTVAYRILARKKIDAENPYRYAVPAGAPIAVTVTDPTGIEVARASLTLDRFGAAHGDFTLSPEASTGLYTLKTVIDGEEHSIDIGVSAYKKPEFEVDVALTKKRFLRDESASATISATYYFGAPVAGAKVRYEIYRDTDWSAEYSDSALYDDLDDDEKRSFSGSNRSYYGSRVAEGKGVLDDSGKLVVKFSPGEYFRDEYTSDDDYAKRLKQTPPQAETLTVTATVIDPSEREVQADSSASVTAADITVSAEPDGYLGEPNVKKPIRILARNADGKRAANVPITITTAFSLWDKKAQETVEKPFGQPVSATTDADGYATVDVVAPRSGDISVTVVAKDSAGREARTSTSYWSSRDTDTDLQTGSDDLAIFTDKRRYAAGETARVLIHTATSGQTALLTIEADGGVLKTISVPIKSRSTTITIPVLAEYGPNVTLAACYVKGKKFASSDTPLRVTLAGRELNISVTPARSDARPGETVPVTVFVKDTSGKPVPNCELSLAAVDEALFALRDDDPKDLRDAFYGPREQGVRTSHSFEIEYLGGDDKGSPVIVARKDFRDTADWKPELVTGADGKVTTDIRFPDNLTTWRLTARALSSDSAVGYATGKIVVNKPFFVRLETARAYVGGDKTRVLGIVHNETDRAVTARVKLIALGMRGDSAAEQEVTVEAKKTATVSWPLTVDNDTDAARFTLTAWTSDRTETDGVERGVPVRPFGRQEIATKAGFSRERAQKISVDLAPESSPQKSGLTLRVTAGAGGAVSSALDSLIGFPYGCTEQTMSRFLPDVLAKQTDPRLLSPGQREQLPAMIRDGVARLTRFQHPSGAWGWWQYDSDDAFLTAYVLDGLLSMRDAGIAPPAQVLENGLKALDKMESPKAPDKQSPYALSVLARGGKPSIGRKALPLLEKTAAKQGTRALAYTVLLARTLNLAAPASYNELQRRLIRDDFSMHWGEDDPKFGVSWDQSARLNTAAGLRALLAVDPNDSRASGIVRWLMRSRTDASFGDTRDTANVLGALCEYLKARPEEAAPIGNVSVTINGRAARVDGDGRELRVVAESGTLRVGPNSIVVTRAGDSTATLYWSATVKQAIVLDPKTKELAPNVVEGIRIGRDYAAVPERGSLTKMEPATSFRQGDRVRVRLTIETPRDLEYVLIEDFFPSGFETASVGTDDLEITGDWGFWYSHVDVRDDRVAVFARRISKGKQTFEYYLRAQTPGTFRALPAGVSAMYRANLHAESRDSRLDVTK